MRKFFTLFVLFLLLGGAYLFFSAKGKQNKMVQLKEGVEAQWGQVMNVYQRRADLIPNLVNTVKGYKDFEQETLVEVTEARAKVGQITVDKNILENPALMEKFNSAQGELGQTLSRLMVVSERYPDLKANEQFNNLMIQLEGTENRISQERRKFNESARGYNTYIKQFPTNIYASIFGFDETSYFEASPGAEDAPTVEF